MCCGQGVEESSITIGLDDAEKIDLAVVGCVAVSPKGSPLSVLFCIVSPNCHGSTMHF